MLEGDNWDENNFNWQEIIYDMHMAGFGSSCLLRIYVFLDPKNSARTVLFVNICRRESISTTGNPQIIRRHTRCKKGLPRCRNRSLSKYIHFVA